MVVKDAFGKKLSIGDTICWVGDPSHPYRRRLRKGMLLKIDDESFRPRLIVRAFDNPYGRNATLINCGRGRGISSYFFSRVVKLS